MARLVTTQELADIFKVSLRTIQRWKADWLPVGHKQPKAHGGFIWRCDLAAAKEAAAAIGLWDELVDMPLKRKPPIPTTRRLSNKHGQYQRRHHGQSCEECRTAIRQRNRHYRQQLKLKSKETAA